MNHLVVSSSKQLQLESQSGQRDFDRLKAISIHFYEACQADKSPPNAGGGCAIKKKMGIILGLMLRTVCSVKGGFATRMAFGCQMGVGLCVV